MSGTRNVVAEQKQVKMCPHCSEIHDGDYIICEKCRNKFPKNNFFGRPKK